MQITLLGLPLGTGICLNFPGWLWNKLPALQYSRNCSNRGLPLSPFSPLCPRGPGGPCRPGGPAGPLSPRRTDSMLSKAQVWVLENRREPGTALARELLFSMRWWLHRITYLWVLGCPPRPSAQGVLEWLHKLQGETLTSD